MCSLSFDPNSISLNCNHFINGKQVSDGEDKIQVIRPSDGVIISTVNAANDQLIDETVQIADQAFRNSGWAESPPLERTEVLVRWADLLEENSLELAQLEAATTTRPIVDVTNRDLVRATGALRYFAHWADKIEGQLLPTSATNTSINVPEPYGVIGSIAPFNFPIINAIWKSAPALAVGNSVVLKPSELTPFSAVRIAELASEAGLPKGLFNVIQGGGTTGSSLVRHPLVRKITFTGSSVTGAKVMAEAARHGTKPVILELGGKSPQLVLSDIKGDQAINQVVQEVANGFLYNSGQVCTAGTRLIIPQNMLDEYMQRLIDKIKSRIPGPTWQMENNLPPIISEKQALRIDKMLAQTIREGAQVLCGGKRFKLNYGGAYYEPTIIQNVQESSVGFMEEFFGPVLLIDTYLSEEEGIRMANHPFYALGASLYTNDATKALSIPGTLEAGTVWVNTHGRQPDYSTPQGGINGSGFGKEMGRLGLESYCRYKTIWFKHGLK